MSEDHTHKIGDISPVEKEELSAEQKKFIAMNIAKGLLGEEKKFPTEESNKLFDVAMKGLGVEEKRDIIQWRKIFSKFMLKFLPIQYIVIIIFLVLQGFGFCSFELDNYIFYILIAGTLVQSYFLIQIIFKYMFSEKR